MTTSTLFTTGSGTQTSRYSVTYNPVTEGSPASITVTRLEGSFTDVVSWTTISGTATSSGPETSNSDFTASSDSFSLGKDGTTTLSIPTTIDTLNEGAEFFYIQFTDVAGKTTGVKLTIEQVINDPLNVVPDARDDAGTTSEDAPVTFTPTQLLGNDVDANNGDVLTITGVGGASNGTVAMVDGSVVFTPTANYAGSASFTYTVSDGKGGTDTATVNLTVNPVNDPPVAVDITDRSSSEDQRVSFQVPAFTDLDNASLTYTATLANGASLPAWLSFDAATRTFSGQPPANFTGALDVTVTGSDGSRSASDDFQLTITPVNDAPVVVDDAGTVAEEGVVTLDLLANDTDVDGPANTITAVSVDPAQGTVRVVDGQVEFTAAKDFNGDATITYTLSDGTLGDQGQAVVAVTPVNDAPAAAALADVSSPEDDLVSFQVPTFTDVDNATLTYTATLASGAALPSWLEFDAAALTFSGQPPANENGAIDVTVTGSDGQLSASSSFTLTLTPVNDAPVAAVLQDRASDEDAGFSFTVPASSDVDGDALTYEAALADGGALPAWLRFDATSLTFSGTPPQDYNGVVSVQLTTSDGEASTAQTFDLTIDPVNDEPVVSGAVTGAAAEDGAPASLDALANASDVDRGDTLSVVVPAAADLPAGVTYDVATRAFVLDPSHAAYQSLASGAATTVTVNYGVSDGTATTAASARWTVTGTNDGPVAVADRAAGGENERLVLDVLANDTDADDGHALTLLSGVAPEGKGTVAVVDGELVFDPGTAFDQLAVGKTETVTLEYEMRDEHGARSSSTVTVTVTGANDGPVARNDVGTTAEDTAIRFTPGQLLGNDDDVDGDALSIASVSGATGGTVALDRDGSVVFTPAANYHGPASFTYTASDGHGGTASATVSLTVTSVNDAPTATADGFGAGTSKIYEGSEYVIDVTDLLGNDVDVDGDAIQFSGIATGAGKGTVSLLTEGGKTYLAYTYTGAQLAENATATDSFTYRVTDGLPGGVGTGTVNLTVTGLANKMTLGTNGIDTLNGSSTAHDTIDGLNADDFIYGQGGNDKLFGSNGVDRLFGGDGADVLDGGRGDDRLEGGRGNDALTGGLGADSFEFLPVGGAVVNTGVDKILDFKAGTDRIALGTGITVAGVTTGHVDANGELDTTLTLSNGGSVQVMDVVGLTDAHWTMIA